MSAILILGYKNSDIGVFSEKDRRLPIIKEAIRRDLIRWLDKGVEWLVFTGNLGFEYWVLEVAKELQGEYPLQLATIFPFENHGANWNEANQAKLSAFKQVDFVKYSYESYQNPSQFRHYNQFLLDNTSAAYIFYDKENETNLHYFVDMAEVRENYRVDFLTFERLNEAASDYSEEAED